MEGRVDITYQNCLTPFALLAALPLLAACSVTVSDADVGKKAGVDIQSPIGDLSVRTDVDARNTGLPVYPGARPLRDGQEPESANVNIRSALFGLEVLAAKYESDVAPNAIVEYYNREMRTYGDVIECRGNIDFKGRMGSQRPVCKASRGPARSSSSQVQKSATESSA